MVKLREGGGRRPRVVGWAEIRVSVCSWRVGVTGVSRTLSFSVWCVCVQAVIESGLLLQWLVSLSRSGKARKTGLDQVLIKGDPVQRMKGGGISGS